MTDPEYDYRFRPVFTRTTPSLEALKLVAVARVARDLALESLLKAERDLYDAEQELQAVRLLAPKFNNRYSK